MELADTQRRLLEYKQHITAREKELLASIEHLKTIDHLEEAREIIRSLRELSDENNHLIRKFSNGSGENNSGQASLELQANRFCLAFDKLQNVLELFLDQCVGNDMDKKEAC